MVATACAQRGAGPSTGCAQAGLTADAGAVSQMAGLIVPGVANDARPMGRYVCGQTSSVTDFVG